MLRKPEAEVEGFVESDGVRIHYQVFGAGRQAILLLPTWSIVHSDFWRHQVPHLATRYTVVAFDGRGNGASERPADPEAYAERQFAADAHAVLDAAGIERAAIMSASQGSNWGLVLATGHPDRIAAAVFIADDLPFGPPHPEQEPAYNAFDERRERYEGWEKYNRNYWLEDWPGFLEFFFSKCFTEPDSRAEIEHFIGMGLETTPETIIATVEAPALREDEARRLATSLSCPALVIHGDEDAITPLHRGRELARLAGAELAVLAGSGHEPQCRSPLEVNRLVDAFLEEHYPPS